MYPKWNLKKSFMIKSSDAPKVLEYKYVIRKDDGTHTKYRWEKKVTGSFVGDDTQSFNCLDENRTLDLETVFKLCPSDMKIVIQDEVFDDFIPSIVMDEHGKVINRGYYKQLSNIRTRNFGSL